MTTTDDILREARSLIDTPDKWTEQRAYDAVMHASRSMRKNHYAAMRALVGKKGSLSLLEYHPDTTHEDIMDLFDKAIKIAEGS